MLIRHRRDSKGRDPHLMGRLRLLSVGIGLALGGLLLDQDLLMWGALAVLLVGFALRFIPAPKREEDDPDEA